jgi:phenylpropionate dioxygenase-like ring-hydroxylating dioxygenase large terminal subunit
VFVHQHQLEHVLTPETYYCPRHYEAELERLFLPGWHAVAAASELPRHGDFMTFELFGRPVQLRNIDGEYHSFLNVCAHRHCLLTSQPQGHDPRFRCQYHGWEYNKEGRTGRIPDAGCFRPFDRENAYLRKFRTERCGELIFVSLAEEGPALSEYLGPLWQTWSESFGPPFRYAYRWERTYPANWKIPTENSLESYHIPCLHAKSFGKLPAEEDIQHVLDPRYTTFRTLDLPGLSRSVMNGTVRWLGWTPTNYYWHHHRHPNLIYTSLDVYRMAQIMLPTSPTTCRHVVWVWTIRGHKWGPISWLLYRGMRWAVTAVSQQVLREDVPIFEAVQRGVEANAHRGVIGTREERIFVFQNYVMQAVNGKAS